jgi:carbonic anhydrase/acetyltransferase-like protein (isoleucine patch superfamily)
MLRIVVLIEKTGKTGLSGTQIICTFAKTTQVMANIFEFRGYRPIIRPSSFVHPNATVTGNVTIGERVYIGPGAAIRGDWGQIVIEDGCNVQENCTIHMFPGTLVLLKESAHIGHGAIIHGATIGKNCLIGMNAVLMDDVILGDECIVGALSFVAGGQVFEKRQLIVGNPAKAIKSVSDEMMEWKTKGTELYQQLPADCYASLRPCEPLRRPPAFRPLQQEEYKNWKKNKK